MGRLATERKTPLSQKATSSLGDRLLRITGSLLEALVGIVKDRPTFKTANLPGSFTALGQNIINEALMRASRYFETDTGCCFYVLVGPYFHEHSTCPESDVPAFSQVLCRDLRPDIRFSASDGLS